MADWLGGHPNVFVSAIKEPHFFNTDLDVRFVRTETEYESLFSGVTSQHSIVAEASVWYLYSKNAVPNILSYSPQAKFVVMLRNPVEMAYSLYQQLRFSNEETLESFWEAWRKQDARRMGEGVPSLCRDHRQLLYGEVCMLGKQVQRLLGIVPRDRVVFIFMEDLRKAARTEYLRVLELAGLPDDGRQGFDAVNSAKVRRSPLLAANIEVLRRVKRKLRIPNLGTPLLRAIDQENRITRPSPALPEELKQELTSYFASDVRLLGELLDRDLNHWSGKPS